MSGNTATNYGGGINNAGTLLLDTSTVSGNTAGGDAGGIYNASTGMLMLTHSTVSGNTAGDDAGGIRNAPGGTLILVTSTVSGNTAGDDGGGIRNGLATLTLVTSTVSGNHANLDGGGIYNIGTAHVLNSTITNNQADAELNGLGTGGGVYNVPAGPLNASGGIFQFHNTILAGNFETLAFGDCSGTLTSHGNNVMQQVNCTVNGGGVTVADPVLGPLQNNGGPTLTHALRAGSPAIDGGNPDGCLDHLGALLLEDQRGLPRPVDGNGDGTARCDIGAIEFQPSDTPPSDLVLHNAATQQVAFWLMTGTTVTNGAFAILNGTIATLPPNWQVSGTGDFNADGQPDLVLHNPVTQQVAFWLMTGTTVMGGAFALLNGTIATLPPGWQVSGTGDFNSDGQPDLVLHNPVTQQVAFWLMTGTTVMGGAFALLNGTIATLPPNWQVSGTGDFNADGQPDLVLHNPVTQQVAFWLMTGTTVMDGAFALLNGTIATLPPGWQVSGTGDFNSDGQLDLVLHNAATQQVAFWLMTGTTVMDGAFALLNGTIATLPPGWQVEAAR